MMTVTQERVSDLDVDRRCQENSARVLVPQTLVQTQRILLRWSRDLTTVLESLALPVVFLLTLNIVLGQVI
jgi:ABC-2 type transport system permease protein